MILYFNKIRHSLLFCGVFFLTSMLTACGGGGGGGGGSNPTVPVVPPVVVPPVDENTQPTISGVPPTTVLEDALYSFTPIASDADGNTLLFSISNNPAWLSINSATGRLSGKPANADVGTTPGIVISVDDQQGATNSRASLPPFNLTVNNTNDPPTISGTPGTTIEVDLPYSFIPVAFDVDPTNDPLRFSIKNKPGWASFDPLTGELKGTPVLGTTTGIVITVDDQQGQTNSTASLAPFDLSVRQGFNEAIFAETTVSSTTSPERQYQANDGVDTVADNGWVGTEDVATETAWIRLDFDSKKTIYRVALSDVVGNAAQLTAGSIEFSDGTKISIAKALSDDGTPVDFVFDAIETDSVQINLSAARGAFGLAEIATYSLLDPGQTLQFQDLFNDGNSNGWAIVNTGCQKGSSSWDPAFSFWSAAGNQFRQTGDCRGFSDEGVELGTYALRTTSIPAGMDLRLRLRSDGDASPWTRGAMGVLFGYIDSDNYYRFDLNKMKGHRKLLKKEAGVFTELGTSPQSYTPGDWPTSYSPDAWVNLRVVHENGVIVVYVNGEKVMAAEDSSFSGGQLALLCARNESCTFDNIVVLDAPTDPVAGVNIIDGVGGGHSSGEYFVGTDGTLDVAAVLTSSSGVDRVEFVVDEGLSGERTLIDFTSPYNSQFTFLPTGKHMVNVYLLDSGGMRLTAAEASDVLPLVGTGGIHLVGLGDSITNGLYDDIDVDDVSTGGWNTSSGYESVLNNLLTADNAGQPVTILNEGNSGELSVEGAQRIAAVLERTPATQAYLVIYGANDSGGGTPTPSGINKTPGDGGYAGSFKDNLQQIIDLASASGKQVILAKAPPHLNDATRDAIIQTYNQVIDQLIMENGFSYTPPDFHTYFTNNPAEMVADGLHPNGVGYQSMAKLWCSALNGQMGISCSP